MKRAKNEEFRKPGRKKGMKNKEGEGGGGGTCS